MRKKLFIQTSGKQMVNEGIDHDRGSATPQGLWAPRKDVKQVRWKDTRAIINATMKGGIFHTHLKLFLLMQVQDSGIRRPLYVMAEREVYTFQVHNGLWIKIIS